MSYAGRVISIVHGEPLDEGLVSGVRNAYGDIKRSGQLYRSMRNTNTDLLRSLADKARGMGAARAAFSQGKKDTASEILRGTVFPAHKMIGPLKSKLNTDSAEFRQVMGRNIKRGVATAAVIGGIGTALHLYKKLRNKSKNIDPRYRAYDVYPEYGYAAVGQGPEVAPEFSNRDDEEYKNRRI